MLDGGLLKIGQKSVDFLPIAVRRPCQPVFKIGEGVRSFSRMFAPVHISLWERDLSHLTAPLEDMFKDVSAVGPDQDVRSVEFEKVKAEVEELSKKHNLGVKLIVVKFVDLHSPEFPGLGMEGHLIPMLIAENIDISLRESMTIIINGEEEVVLSLGKREGESEILALEGRGGIHVKEIEAPAVKEMRIYEGGGTEGYAIGEAEAMSRIDLSQIEEEREILESEIEGEVKQFGVAFDNAIERLKESEDRMGTPDAIKFFQGLQRAVANIRTKITECIRTKKYNTRRAAKEVLGKYMTMFESQLKDDKVSVNVKAQFRDQMKQFQYFYESILRFRYQLPANVISDIEKKGKKVVVIAEEISPNDAAHMDPSVVSGVGLGKGTRTDHSIIVLKNSGIPTVYGLGNAVKGIKDGDTVIEDAEEGRLIVNPTPEVLAEYLQKQKDHLKLKEALKTMDDIGITKTLDGREIHIGGNADDIYEVDDLVKAGSIHGIAMFRSEIFYMRALGETRQQEPSEAESVRLYKDIAGRILKHSSDLSGHEYYRGLKRPVLMEVIIRTIDLGEDKQLPYINTANGMSAITGLRGLKLCLEDRTISEIFRRQIRSILLASENANLKIMFPVVNSREEFLKAREQVYEIMEQLRKEGKAFNEKIEIGAMIETTDGVNNVEAIAEAADFLSIGTNDLTQFITGASRLDPDPESRKRYDEFDPRVIRAIKAVIEMGRLKGKLVSICGDMASNPLAAFVLLGLGLEKFSMAANSIAVIKHIISNVSAEDCRELAGGLETITTSQQAKVFIKDYVFKKMADGTWIGLAEPPEFRAVLENRIRLLAGESPA